MLLYIMFILLCFDSKLSLLNKFWFLIPKITILWLKCALTKFYQQNPLTRFFLIHQSMAPMANTILPPWKFLYLHIYILFFAVQFVCSINTTWKCSLIFLTTHAVHLVTWLASFFCNFFFYILHLTHIVHLQADQLNNQPPIRLFTPDCISLLLRYGHNCDASDFKFLFCCLFSISAFEVAIWNVISGIRYTG